VKSLINVLVVLGLISAPLFANEPTAAAPSDATAPTAEHHDAAAPAGKVAKKAKKTTKSTSKTTTTEHNETAAPAGEAHPAGN
jgi:hypothetical protein